MEELYKPFENKEVTKSDIQLLLDNTPLLTQCVEQNIYKVLRREKQLQSDSGGIEALALHTTLAYVNNTLRYDMARAPFFLCAVEKSVKHAIPLSNHAFYIGGIIDRYEIYKEIHTILDYKTGNPDYVVQTISDLFDRTKTKLNKAALQSLIYAYIISETEKVRTNVFLYFIREIHTKTDPRICIEKKPSA